MGRDILTAVGEAKRATEKGLSKGEVRKRRYPWARCVEDGKKTGLDKGESAERCTYIACCVSKLPNKVKESGRCGPVDCAKPPKGAGKP